MKLNLPIFLTIFRIIIIPFFIFMFYAPFTWAKLSCIILFLLASITDLLDGILARFLNQKTNFGKFLDPIADKLIILTALILNLEYFHSYIITIPIIITIYREIIISSLRAWISENKILNNISVLFISKIKTTIQMLAITILLCKTEGFFFLIGIYFLYFSTILSLLSLLIYFYYVYNNLN